MANPSHQPVLDQGNPFRRTAKAAQGNPFRRRTPSLSSVSQDQAGEQQRTPGLRDVAEQRIADNQGGGRMVAESKYTPANNGRLGDVQADRQPEPEQEREQINEPVNEHTASTLNTAASKNIKANEGGGRMIRTAEGRERYSGPENLEELPATPKDNRSTWEKRDKSKDNLAQKVFGPAMKRNEFQYKNADELDPEKQQEQLSYLFKDTKPSSHSKEGTADQSDFITRARQHGYTGKQIKTFLDTSEDADLPLAPTGEGITGKVAEAGRGAARGLAMGAADVARAGQWFTPDAMKEADIFKGIADDIESMVKRNPQLFMESDENKERSWYNPMKALVGGPEMVARMAPGMMGLPGGVAVQFWGSMAQKKYDQLSKEKPDMSESKKMAYSTGEGIVQGGLEWLQTKIPAGVFGKMIPGKAKGEMLRKAAGMAKTGKAPLFGALGTAYIAELATETGQDTASKQLDYYSGLEKEGVSLKDIGESLKNNAGPILFTTFALSGPAHISDNNRRKQIKDTLTAGRDNVAQEDRVAAVMEVYNSVKQNDEKLAKAWVKEALPMAVENMPVAIPTDDNYFNAEPEQGALERNRTILDLKKQNLTTADLVNIGEDPESGITPEEINIILGERSAEMDEVWSQISDGDQNNPDRDPAEAAASRSLKEAFNDLVYDRAVQRGEAVRPGDESSTEQIQQEPQDVKAAAEIVDLLKRGDINRESFDEYAGQIMNDPNTSDEAKKIIRDSGPDEVARFEEEAKKDTRRRFDEGYKTLTPEQRSEREAEQRLIDQYGEKEAKAIIEKRKKRAAELEQERADAESAYRGGVPEGVQQVSDEEIKKFEKEVEGYRWRQRMAAQERKVEQDNRKADEILSDTTVPKEVMAAAKKQAEAISEVDPVYSHMKEAKARGGIDLQAFKQDYDKDTVAMIGRRYPGVFSKSGRVKPDDFASEMGYESLDEMIQDFSHARTKKDLQAQIIKEQTDQWQEAEAAQQKYEADNNLNASEAEVDSLEQYIRMAPDRLTPDVLEDSRFTGKQRSRLFQAMREATATEVAGNKSVTPKREPGKKAKNIAKRLGNVKTKKEQQAGQKTETTEKGKEKSAAGIETVDNKDSIVDGQEFNADPTEAQKEAENYKKAHVRVDGMEIAIENPAGSTRSGKDDGGREWTQKLSNDYGYIKGSVGYDKDHVDIFFEKGYEGGSEKVHIVNQYSKDGFFDEHKIVIGASNKRAALRTYKANYEKGWKGGKSVIEMPMEEFKEWVKSDAPKKGPATASKDEQVLSDKINSAKNDTELRGAAKEYYQKVLRKRTAEHPKLPGPIKFTRRGMNKTISSSADTTKLKALPHIINLIEGGDYVNKSRPNNPRKKRYVEWYHRIDNTVELDGVEFSVNILLEEQKNGTIHYNLRLTKIEKRSESVVSPRGSQKREADKAVTDSSPSAKNISPPKKEVKFQDIPQGQKKREKPLTKRQKQIMNWLDGGNSFHDFDSVPEREQPIDTGYRPHKKVIEALVNRDLIEFLPNHGENGEWYSARVIERDNMREVDAKIAAGKQNKPVPAHMPVQLKNKITAREQEDKKQITAQAESELSKEPTYGKKNKLFTEDAAAKARELLKSKLGQLSSGLDPEMMQAGITLAGYHVEAGAKSFVDYSKAMIADLGEAIKPFLRSFYEGVRYYPGMDNTGMSTAKEIEMTDLDNLDSGKVNKDDIDEQIKPSKEETIEPELKIEEHVFIDTKYGRKEYILVTGNTKDHVDRIKSAGRWRRWVPSRKAWRFPQAQAEAVKKNLADLLSAPEQKTKSEETAETANTNQQIADRVADSLKNNRRITYQQLFKWADEAYGGTQAQGKYTVKDAYDALELGINQYIENLAGLNTGANIFTPRQDIGILKDKIMRFIPTQSKRTAEMDEFQQFSTPPPLAFMANWVAKPQKGEVYLEPSAGVGGIAVFGKNAGAKVYVNELSDRRRGLLKQLGFEKVTGENAEHLNSILPKDIKPTVIVMNPPFSATAGRIKGKRATKIGAQHVEQALKRLEPGGRLVAIVGEGMAMDKPSFTKWWNKIKGEYNVRANIGISGKGYRKYGTTFDNQILVIDKTGPTTDNIVTGKVDYPADLVPLLESIRNERKAVQQDKSGQAGEKETAASQGQGRVPESGSVVPAPADEMGPEQRPGDEGKGNIPEPSGNRVPDSGPEKGGKVRGEMGPGGRGKAKPSPEKENGPGGSGVGTSTGSPVGNNGGGPSPSTAGDDVPPELSIGIAAGSDYSGIKLSDSIYEEYKPEKIRIKGSKKHPAPLSQSAAMASVPMPDPSYPPKIPRKTITSGALSDVQLEAIVYAGQAHGKKLPSGERQGFLIGDGTGIGKGREVAGIMWDNWNHGRKKAVWISETANLFNDAKRDIDGVGWDSSVLFPQSKTKATGSLPKRDGVLYTTYSTVKSKARGENGAEGKGRLQQIVDWLGEDFDGVIAFDESHNMGNAVPLKGKRGPTKPSKMALAGVELQKLLPNARIVYLSATGATEISNFSYAERLGLWGEGTAFPNKMAFIDQVSAGGTAAMELIARDMKAMGVYLARSISYDGVEYERIEHTLSKDQHESYNTVARAWQKVLANMNEALDLTGAGSNGRASAMSSFWSANQRFFSQYITTLQMPTVIKAISKDLKNGHAVVIQLVNTFEAATERGLAKLEEGMSLEDLDISPFDDLMMMVEKSFPVAQYEEYEDENGNVQKRPVLDSEGNPVLNADAVAMREKLLDDLGSIRGTVADNPLDQIIDEFGVDNVAEVTGRKRRVVWVKEAGGKKRVIQKRSKASGRADTQDFMDDKKRVLIFSQAGGTGSSYHADNTAVNRRKRQHYLLQAGWRADKAVQGLGRTHRSNQKQPPKYTLPTTNLKGQKRFLSSIARRLEQLGALTKGQRQTGNQGIFSERDNLESEYAKDALRRLFIDLNRGRVEGISLSEFEQQSGLKLTDEETGRLKENLPQVTQFLNRILSMEIDVQNTVFDAFSQRIDDVLAAHAKAGTLDVGLETLVADSVVKENEVQVYKDENSGAETKYVRLTVKTPAPRLDFRTSGQYAKQGYYRNKISGKTWAVTRRMVTNRKTGQVVETMALTSPTYRKQNIPVADFSMEKWEHLSPESAKKAWRESLEGAPKTITEKQHLITGALLPIWDKLSGHPRIMRVQTDSGERMIGRLIPEEELDDVLGSLGVDATGAKTTIDMSPDDIFSSVFDNGDTVRLADGTRIERRRVSGDDRIEVKGMDPAKFSSFERYGMFSERINWQTRYFIPATKDGIIVIEKLTARNPVASVDGKKTGSSSAEIGETYASYDTVEQGGVKYEVPNESAGSVYRNSDAGTGISEPESGPQQTTMFVPEEGAQRGRTRARKKFLEAYPARIGTFKHDRETITAPQDAAHVLAPLGTRAQETFLALVLDKNKKPIAVIQHSIGGPMSNQIFIPQLIGSIHNLKGAESFWVAHNHPSGSLQKSDQDINLTQKLQNAVDGSGLVMDGHLIMTPAGKAVALDTMGREMWAFDEGKKRREKRFTVPAVKNKSRSVSVKERRLRGAEPELITTEQITSATDARDKIRDYSKGRNGILLLNTQHQPIMFVPATLEDMKKMRGGRRGLAGRLYRILDKKNNAVAAILNFSGDSTSHQDAEYNFVRFANAIGVKVLDSFMNGKSRTESGVLNDSSRQAAGDVFYSKTAGSPLPSSQRADIKTELSDKKNLGRAGLRRMIRNGSLEIVSPERARQILGTVLGAKMSVQLLHGSGASGINRFDLDMAGSNDGTAYGFGVYLTDSKAVARYYAEHESGKRDGSGYAPKRKPGQRNIYKAEIASGKDFVDWEHITPKQKQKLIAEIRKQYPDAADSAALFLDMYEDGGNAYRNISFLVGGDAEASRLFLDAGIDGITYPVGLMTGKSQKGTNYVVFDADAINIMDSIKYSKDGRRVEAFTLPDGTVYLIDGNIRKGEAMAVLSHELGVHAKHLGFKETKSFDRVLKMLKSRAKKNTAEGAAIRDAYDRVPDDTPTNHRDEEALAYLITNSPEIGIVRRFIAALKKFLVEKMGVTERILSNLDLQALALAVVKREAGKPDIRESRITDGQVVMASMAEQFGVSLKQLQKEYEAVESKYKGTDKWMKAPGGQPTKLTERNWVLVRTPQFKKWFGEWEKEYGVKEDGTKQGNKKDSGQDTGTNTGAESTAQRAWRLDADTGEPRVFFHGTGDSFSGFDTDHQNRKDKGWLGRGIYLTSSPDIAGFYANQKRGEAGPNIMPLFANVRNPYIADVSLKEKLRFASQGEIDRFTEQLVKEGYDGVVVEHPHEKNLIEIVALSPAQIKSATGNSGAFSPDNPDIRYSKSQKTRQDKLKYNQAITGTENLNATVDGTTSTTSEEEGASVIYEILRKLKESGVAGPPAKYSETRAEGLIKKYHEVAGIISDPHRSIAEKQKFAAGFAQVLPAKPRARLLQKLSTISRYKTTAAQQRHLNKFLNRAERILTRHLKRELLDRIEKRIEPTKGNKGERKGPGMDVARGRGAKLERDLKYIRDTAIKLANDREVSGEVARLNGVLMSLEDEFSGAENNKEKKKLRREIEDTESMIVMADLFGGLSSKPLAEIIKARKALEFIFENDQAEWRQAQEFWRNRNEINREAAARDITGLDNPTPETSGEESRRIDRERSFRGKAKESLRSVSNAIQSWEFMLDVISGKSGKGTLNSWLVKHFGSLVHKATRDYERMQMDVNDGLMDKAMKIFKVKSKAELARKFADANVKTKDKVFLYKDGKRDSLAISPLEAAYWYQISKDRTNKVMQKTFEGMGITDRTMMQIEKLMGRKMKAWADYLVEEFYQDFHYDTNEVYKQVYGIDLEKNENYVPWMRELTGRAADKQKEGFLAGMISGSIKKGFMHVRVKNYKKFRMMNMNDVLMNHVADMNHFKAWAIPSREINGTFNDQQIQKYIRQYYGASALRAIRKFQSDFVKSDSELRGDMVALDRFRGRVTTAMIGANPVVFLKQLTSFPAYAAAIPAVQWAKHAAYAFAHPVKAAKILGQSTMMKSRYKKGFERDVAAAMRRGSGDVLSQSKNLPDKLMVLTKLGDKAAIVVGGYAVYKYHYDQNLKNGMSEKRAHEKALTEFEMATERTQQAGNVKDLGSIQRGDPLMKLLTMYMTAPASYTRQVFAAVRNARSSKKRDTAKRLFLFGVVLPMMFQAVADAFMIFGGDDDDKERFLKNQAKAIALGPFNGLPVLRDVASGALNAASGDYWMMTRQQYSPVLEPINVGLKSIYHGGKYLRDGRDHEMLMRSLWEAAQFAGYRTGIPVRPAGKVLAGISDATGVDLPFRDSKPTEHKVRRGIGYSRYVIGEK